MATERRSSIKVMERGDLLFLLKAHPKNEETAEIFSDLHMEKCERTIKPLFEGIWQ